jgi:hypothetical protein
VDSLSDPLYWHHATSTAFGTVTGLAEAACLWAIGCLWWLYGTAFTAASLPFWGLAVAYLAWRKVSRVRADRRAADVARQKKAAVEPVAAPKGFGKPGHVAPPRKWDAALPVRSGGSAKGDPPAQQAEGSFFGSRSRQARWQAIKREPGSA